MDFEYNYAENCRSSLRKGDNTGKIYENNNEWVKCGLPSAGDNVFDPAKYYEYSLDPTKGVPDIVQKGAGMGKIWF